MCYHVLNSYSNITFLKIQICIDCASYRSARLRIAKQRGFIYERYFEKN